VLKDRNANARRLPRLSIGVTLLLASWGCAATAGRPLPSVAFPSCRAAAWEEPLQQAVVQWEDDEVAAADRRALDRWCRGVGPAVYLNASGGIASPGPIAVVSWNVNVGAGDLRALVADLRSGRLTGGRPVSHFVLLLQEALRRGAAVPPLGGDQAGARRLVRGPAPIDIVSFARDAGLSLYYVPSMRNGFDAAGGAEDRGNAIVSTLPLTELRALELPFERQRRVAILARIGGAEAAGGLTVASVHLDPFVSARRLWVVGAAAARGRQARALTAVLPATAPLVVGGDFNTWSGTREPALLEMQRVTAPVSPSTKPTFGNRVLDHLFFRTPAAWSARSERADRAYGSDHFPVVGWVQTAARDADGST
jgi:endonuclease/exonuclease/phosphatase family metal-dependent hydrolase